MSHNAITPGCALDEEDFRRLSAYIQSTCGIQIPRSKKNLLETRLSKRLRFLGLSSFNQYCTYLFSKKGLDEESGSMLDAVSTNKTEFFREPDHFSYLIDKVVLRASPETGASRTRPFAVWSAGCSTGEEAYTLAMVLGEAATRRPGFSFSIFATDISTRVLEKAKAGIYGEEQVETIPNHLKKRYLLRSKDKDRRLVKIGPELRSLVTFERFNLMSKDYALGERFDAIFCRNVIIYFDRPTQMGVLNRLSASLAPGGHLFVGHSETLHGMGIPLRAVAPTVYEKIE